MNIPRERRPERLKTKSSPKSVRYQTFVQCGGSGWIRKRALGFGRPALGHEYVMTGEAPIIVVPYDLSWPDQFEQERNELLKTIQEWIVGGIEHVGSTAIPGLAAKPVIDIAAGVESLEASRPAIAILTDAGYCYSPYRPDVEHWFCKPSPAFRTHHLHLVPFRSTLWDDRLAFRDYLRAHPSVAREYEQLKYELAAQYRLDREAYTDAKAPFIARVLQMVRLKPDTTY